MSERNIMTANIASREKSARLKFPLRNDQRKFSRRKESFAEIIYVFRLILNACVHLLSALNILNSQAMYLFWTHRLTVSLVARDNNSCVLIAAIIGLITRGNGIIGSN